MYVSMACRHNYVHYNVKHTHCMGALLAHTLATASQLTVNISSTLSSKPKIATVGFFCKMSVEA